MAKKSIKVEVKKEVKEVKQIVVENVCAYCGKPATIRAANGKQYCCLACQSNDKS
jgi:hypothetical protein